jgi:glucose/arabinose dehydrogenase
LTILTIASIAQPRELAFSPNGDLFVGTTGTAVYVVPNAEGVAHAGTPRVFATISDAPAAGITFSQTNCSIYVGTQHGVYRIPYVLGDLKARAAPIKVASVRTGSIVGGDNHITTSVAAAGYALYASVGSSCNACTEKDPTRATIQQMTLSGSGMAAKAVHIRNAIALAINPNTGTLWAGGAGQDALPLGHPYEYFDAVSIRSGVVNYGWPICEENQRAYVSGANCSAQAIPRIEFPAYETIIGAAFVPRTISGTYALPSAYAGGLFVAMHGSWHAQNGIPIAPPRVAFVRMTLDQPASAVNWISPTTQWTDVVRGFQTSSGSRIGRPTGVAIGPSGDLFVGDDQTGRIYRIRP